MTRAQAAGPVSPAGFPGPGEATRYRRWLDAVVSGEAPAPPCVPRFSLPRPAAWSHGAVHGATVVTDVETWAPGVVFGGYLACLADQFAGLAMMTVLPDGMTFLTADLQLDLRSPVRPGEVAIAARVLRVMTRRAAVHVTIGQAGKSSCHATVTQALVARPGRGTP